MNATPTVIAAAINDAPAWALVSLTMPDADLLERGAEELARWIAQRLDAPQSPDRRQLGLPL